MTQHLIDVVPVSKEAGDIAVWVDTATGKLEIDNATALASTTREQRAALWTAIEEAENYRALAEQVADATAHTRGALL